jgi:hypothetical protein
MARSFEIIFAFLFWERLSYYQPDGVECGFTAVYSVMGRVFNSMQDPITSLPRGMIVEPLMG